VSRKALIIAVVVLRYFKQVAQSARTGGQDDFLGSVNVSVAEVPSTGCERWFKLEGRSAKSNIQGSIRLRFWLSTREDRGLSEEEDMWNEIRQQENIYAIFLEHTLREGLPQVGLEGEKMGVDLFY